MVFEPRARAFVAGTLRVPSAAQGPGEDILTKKGAGSDPRVGRHGYLWSGEAGRWHADCHEVRHGFRHARLSDPIVLLHEVRRSGKAGIPFLAAFHSTPIVGIPLARLDKLSVVMTYARGLFGGMAIIGFIFTFMAFMMWVTGEHLDELAQTMVACGCLLGARGFCRPVHLFVPFADDKAGACNPAVMSRDTGDRGGSRTNAARFRQDSRRHVAAIARTYRAGRTGARTGAHASTHCAWESPPSRSRITPTICWRESGFKRPWRAEACGSRQSTKDSSVAAQGLCLPRGVGTNAHQRGAASDRTDRSDPSDRSDEVRHPSADSDVNLPQQFRRGLVELVRPPQLLEFLEQVVRT